MALDYGQRMARARTMRKYSRKMAMSRKRLSKRLASTDKLEKRARRTAIKMVRRIVAGAVGVNYSELSAAQKMEIDKRVAKKTALVDRLAKRLLPKMRTKDRQRLAKRKVSESEMLGLELYEALDLSKSTDGVLSNDLQKFIKNVLNQCIDLYGRSKTQVLLDKLSLPDGFTKKVDDYVLDDSEEGGE